METNLITNVGDLKKSINEISVYDLKAYSVMELYYMIASKMNETLQELSRFEGGVSEEVVKQNEKLLYLLGAGLQTEVSNKINELKNNGTLSSIINSELFNDLNAKVILNSSNIANITGKTNNNTSDISTLKSQVADNTTTLINKMDKNTLLSMANLGQDIKTAITGGSVAVVGNNSVIEPNIVNRQVTPLKTSFITEGKNILDVNTLTAGYVHSDGSIKTGNYYTTTYIPFTSGDTLRIARKDNIGINDIVSKRGIRMACFYDANFNVLSDYYYNNTTDTYEGVTYKGSQTVAYIRVSFLKGYADGNSMLYKGDEVSTFEPYKIKIEGLTMNTALKNDIQSILNTSGKLYGLSVLNFGDSIGAGDGNNGKGYAELLAEKYGMVCTDMAQGGATISTVIANNILSQVNSAISSSTTADVILIDGFVNDITNGVALGTISSGYNAVRDTSTFTGALEEICSRLKSNFPTAKIAYVAVHKMSSRDTAMQELFYNRAIEVLDKWSIPVVDVHKKGGLNTYITEHTKLYTNKTSSNPNGDRTHPNELGYTKFYVPMIESVLNEIL